MSLADDVKLLRTRAVRWGFSTAPAGVREYAGKLAAWVGGDPKDPMSNGVIVTTDEPELVAALYNKGFRS